MNGSTQETLVALPAPSTESRRSVGFVPFACAAAVLVLAFAKPLYDLLRFSLATELFSHILLIPFISAYLIWTERAKLPSVSRSRPAAALVPAFAGSLVLLLYFAAFRSAAIPKADYLFFTILAFFCFFLSASISFLGTRFCRSIAFSLGFLIFIVPFPEKITDALEIASQHASANAYAWMMSLSQATYFRNGLIFSLPGLNIQVAQECSGIRSSFVLFITSLLAGHMFLRSSWKKTALAFFVIPLGIARNGFRIWVLSMLTVHWDPRVIDSPLHHKGGPIFFVISLIPFFALLFWLRRTEQPLAASPAATFAQPRPL